MCVWYGGENIKIQSDDPVVFHQRSQAVVVYMVAYTVHSTHYLSSDTLAPSFKRPSAGG